LLFGMLIAIAVASFFGYMKVVKDKSVVRLQHQDLMKMEAENKKSFDEISYYDEHKEPILAATEQLRSGLPGPQTTSDLGSFQDLEMPVIVTQYSKVAKTPGFTVRGEVAEYQRLTAAVASLEEKYPLLQFTAMEMKLPGTSQVMSKEATYLTFSSDLYMPR